MRRFGCVASTVFKDFLGLVKMLERPPIGHFNKTIKQAVCLICRRCNTSELLDLSQQRRLQGTKPVTCLGASRPEPQDPDRQRPIDGDRRGPLSERRMCSMRSMTKITPRCSKCVPKGTRLGPVQTRSQLTTERRVAALENESAPVSSSQNHLVRVLD